MGEKKKGFVWVKIAIFAVLAMVFMSGPLLWYYRYGAISLRYRCHLHVCVPLTCVVSAARRGGAALSATVIASAPAVC